MPSCTRERYALDRQTSLDLLLRNLDAMLALDHEAADALVALLRVLVGEDDEEICLVAAELRRRLTSKLTSW